MGNLYKSGLSLQTLGPVELGLTIANCIPVWSDKELSRLYDQITHLISPCQNGFVPGRFIHTNIYAVSEIINDWKSNAQATSSFINFYDFLKAFDSVSHQSLIRTLYHIGAPLF